MVKLLADAPERIWQCLEGQAYLKATQHFLLSRHVFSQLELSGASSDVAKKLWHSVSSFKETITEVGVAYCVGIGRHTYISHVQTSPFLSCDLPM